jgi:hypothetical protein
MARYAGTRCAGQVAIPAARCERCVIIDSPQPDAQADQPHTSRRKGRSYGADETIKINLAWHEHDWSDYLCTYLLAARAP